MTWRRLADERGVTMVIVALLMTGLLAMLALVIDLGDARAVKRTDQNAADFAALAGALKLAGNDTSVTGNIQDSQGACQAVIDSLKANAPGMPGSLTLVSSAHPLGCGSFPYPCDDTVTSSTTYTASSSGVYTVTLEYPVPAADIANASFASSGGVNDGGPCDRIKVSLRRASGRFFAGVIGASTVSPLAAATAKGSPSSGASGIAALLLLERNGCNVLSTSGGGSLGAGVDVKAFDSDHPGRIQADSRGSTSGSSACTNNNNSGGYVIYGTALPSASGGGPSIQAETYPSTGAKPATIGTFASLVGGNAWCCTGGVSPPPSGGGIASRIYADRKYNQPPSSSSSTAGPITNLRYLAQQAVGPPVPATGVGIFVVPSTDCLDPPEGASGSVLLPSALAVLYFNCDNLHFRSGTWNFQAQTIVVKGKLTIDGGAVVNFRPPSGTRVPPASPAPTPTATAVYIGGCLSSGCNNGPNDYGVSVAGVWSVNKQLLADTCSIEAGPAYSSPTGATPTTPPILTSYSATSMAVLGGFFQITGQVSMCQTTVYMGDAHNAPSAIVGYDPTLGSGGAVTTDNKGTDIGGSGSSSPPSLGCSATLPCPTSGTGFGYITVSGGSASVDWTAPDQHTGIGTGGSDPGGQFPLNHLAFWSESDQVSQIKGTGSSVTEGVFFMPNAGFTFQGQGTQTQPLDAQFIARTLSISGQGTLTLEPNPNDSVATPVPGGISLIR